MNGKWKTPRNSYSITDTVQLDLGGINRAFATTLIEKSLDINAVSTLMGHASIAMTAQYVEDNPVRLKQICTGLF